MRAAGVAAADHPDHDDDDDLRPQPSRNRRGNFLYSISPLSDSISRWQRLLSLTVPLPKQLRNAVARAVSCKGFVSSLRHVLCLPFAGKAEVCSSRPLHNLDCRLIILKGKATSAYSRVGPGATDRNGRSGRLLPSEFLLLKPRAEHVLTDGGGPL